MNDSLRIGNGKTDFLPYTIKGYTLIVPDSTKTLIGVIVSLDDDQIDLTSNPRQQIHPYANANYVECVVSRNPFASNVLMLIGAIKPENELHQLRSLLFDFGIPQHGQFCFLRNFFQLYAFHTSWLSPQARFWFYSNSDACLYQA